MLELIKIHSIWPGEYHFDKNSIYHHESETLSLSINKTKKFLNWNPKLNFDLSLELTTNWYKNFYLNSIPAMDSAFKILKTIYQSRYKIMNFIIISKRLLPCKKI